MITFQTLINEIYKPKEIAHFKDKVVGGYREVNSSQNMWQMQLPDLMARYGFKPVGSGKFGSVFANPKYPYIIKVFMRDTAYLRWLSFAKDNQDNPLVPKIRGKVIKISKMFYAVRLEKLTPMVSDADEQKMWNQLDETPYGTKVANFIDNNARLIDMHRGNLMMRGKQPVIVDPLYNFYRDGMFTIDPDDISSFKNIFVKV